MASYHAYTLKDGFQRKAEMLTGRKRSREAFGKYAGRSREDMKSIVFIGAGRGVIPLMEYLTSKSNIAVKGIVDEDKDAPGIIRAKQLNVPIGSDVHEFLSGKIDLIINSTGSKEIGDSVSLMGGSDVEIIGGGGTELLCDLIEEAERSRQRVRLQTSILEQVSNAVIVAGINGEVFYMNPYAEKLYQWKTHDAVGKHIFSIMLPENRKADAEELLSATFFEGYWAGEISVQKKDGTQFAAYLTNSVIRDEHGTTTGLISVSSDISELKKAEGAFKTQLSVRRAIEEAVLPGIVVYDTEGMHIYISRGFCKIVGWSEKELIGMKPPFAYWPTEAIDHNTVAFKSILKGKEGTGMVELSYCRRNGERFNALILTAPVHDEYGKVKGWVSSISDITEYKRKEEQLSNSREQLRNLSSHLEAVRESEKADMARRVHDEIGQPFAALKLELVSLARKLADGQKPLIERTDIMSGIIDRGIQAVKGICFELRPWILDDMGITEAIKWQTAEFGKRTAVSCEVFIDPPEFSLVRDLSTTIFRIYQELLRNIEHHARATKVSVGFFRKRDRIILEVRDNGVGIPKECIYDSGSFGLISIREKVIVWGGEVEVLGEEKIGTTIRVIIPLQV
jgi:PAS domain S-box-containing protein